MTVSIMMIMMVMMITRKKNTKCIIRGTIYTTRSFIHSGAITWSHLGLVPDILPRPQPVLLGLFPQNPIPVTGLLKVSLWNNLKNLSLHMWINIYRLSKLVYGLLSVCFSECILMCVLTEWATEYTMLALMPVFMLRLQWQCGLYRWRKPGYVPGILVNHPHPLGHHSHHTSPHRGSNPGRCCGKPVHYQLS